jgi:hypothetical protein
MRPQRVSLQTTAPMADALKAEKESHRRALEREIVTAWLAKMKAAHITRCIAEAQNAGETSCVIYTQDKMTGFNQLHYDWLLYNAEMTDFGNRTVAQAILDLLEPGQFSVRSRAVQEGVNGGRFEADWADEAHYEIRLEWGNFHRCCVQ